MPDTDLDRLIQAEIAGKPSRATASDLDELVRGDMRESPSPPPPGTSPYSPIQEQHPKVSDADRFHIMTLGGAGEAAARFLQDKGLEVSHQGAMYFSMREPPDGDWYVLDPSSFEPIQDITDIGADLGAIGMMGVGAAKGAVTGAGMGFGVAGPPGLAVGGFLGAVGGAGLGGGTSQLARAGYGKLAGIDQTAGEIGSDVAYETAFGAGSEAIGIPLAAGLRRGVSKFRQTVGGRLSQERIDIDSAIPTSVAGSTGEAGATPIMRTVWQMADMEPPAERLVPRKGRQYQFRRPRPLSRADQPIPLQAGRPLEETYGAGARTVHGYDQKALRAKLVREHYEEVEAIIRQQAAARGVTYMEMVGTRIDDVYATSKRARRLYQAVRITGDADQLVRDMTAIIADVTLTPSKQKEIALRLADAWGIQTKGLSNKEIMRIMRRVMADDDFVYREAARKVGIRGSFDPELDLQKLVEKIWKYESAREAIGKAGGGQMIEAGIRGGPARQLQKRPPWEQGEAIRAADLAPFIRQESYRPGTPKGTPSRRKYAQTDDPDLIYKQELEITEAEYKRRVYGEVPEMVGPGTKTLGGPPYFDKPFVDMEARSRQMFERRAGVPWDKAKGAPRTGTSPGRPVRHQGYPFKEFKPGVSHGGPQGGIIPRAEAIDFWRFLSIEDMTFLRIGGREIPLTQPQGQVVSRVIYRMAVSPRAAWIDKWLGKLAKGLQTPKRLLGAALEHWKMQRVAAFFNRRGVTGGATGALAGAVLGTGGITGGVIGAGAEWLGGGVFGIGKMLMRKPDTEMITQLMQKALKQDASRAYQKLLEAQRTLDAYGEDAFRAMIYSALHDPQVREVLEGETE